MIGRPLAVALILALSTAARAAPSDEELERADELLERANGHYEAKRYELAISDYGKAYELTGAPGFLYNIAQSHRLARDCRMAIEFYERYLLEEPNSVLRPKVERFLEEMADCVRAERSSEPRPWATTPTERPHRDQRGTSSWTWVGIGLTGAGAIGLGAGVWFALEADEAAETISSYQGPWGESQQELEAEGQRNETRAQVLGALGGAALVGGVVLMLVSDDGDEPEVGVMKTAGGGGVTWMTRF